MAVKLNSTGGGSVTLDSPSTASNYTVTLPSAAGTLATTTGTLASPTITGTVAGGATYTSPTLTGASITAANSNTVEATSGPTSSQLAGNRNKIINGAMMIDQRNAGAATANTISGYVVDRWAVQQTTTGKLIAQQNAGSVTPPTGFTNYFGVTSQSAYATGAGDQFLIQQPIEGYNLADLAYGTASAATITLSFWVRSSLIGTFSGYLLIYDPTSTFRSYAFTYVIPTANTWTQISTTITGNTANAFGSTTNGLGAWLRFNLGAGANYIGTANSWQSGNNGFVSGSQSIVGTNGATFYITGVQLEKGATATPFENRLYGTELALCQRYLPVTYGGSNLVTAIGQCYSTTAAFIVFPFNVLPRTTPTGVTLGASVGSYATSNATGGNTTLTGLVFGQGGANAGGLTATVASGLVAGNATYFFTPANIYWTGCEL